MEWSLENVKTTQFLFLEEEKTLPKATRKHDSSTLEINSTISSIFFFYISLRRGKNFAKRHSRFSKNSLENTIHRSRDKRCWWHVEREFEIYLLPRVVSFTPPGIKASRPLPLAGQCLTLSW